MSERTPMIRIALLLLVLAILAAVLRAPADDLLPLGTGFLDPGMAVHAMRNAFVGSRDGFAVQRHCGAIKG